MYILEGEYEIQCADRTTRASKGTFVFLPRGVPNRSENVTDTPGSYIYITSPGGFETFMDQMSKATTGDPVHMSKSARNLPKSRHRNETGLAAIDRLVGLRPFGNGASTGLEPDRILYLKISRYLFR